MAMANPIITLLLSVDFVSLILAMYMAIIFYKAKANPMMFYFSLSAIALNVLTLLGLAYNFDWHKASLSMCYFQAIGVSH